MHEDDRSAPLYRELSNSPRLFGLPVVATFSLLGGGLLLFLGATFFVSLVAGLVIVVLTLIAWAAVFWVASRDRTEAPRLLVGLSYRIPARLTSYRRSSVSPLFVGMEEGNGNESS